MILKKVVILLFLLLPVFANAEVASSVRQKIYDEERQKILTKETTECEKGKRKSNAYNIVVPSSSCGEYVKLFTVQFDRLVKQLNRAFTDNTNKATEQTLEHYLLNTNKTSVIQSEKTFRTTVVDYLSNDAESSRNSTLINMGKEMAGDQNSTYTAPRNTGGQSANTNTNTSTSNTNNPDAGRSVSRGLAQGNGGQGVASTGNCGDPDLEMVNGRCTPRKLFCPEGSTSIACGGSFATLIKYGIYLLLFLAGIVALIFIIIGGYKYMTAGSNSDQASDGKSTITNAVIGLILVMLAYAIVATVIALVSTDIGDAGGGSTPTQQEPTN